MSLTGRLSVKASLREVKALDLGSAEFPLEKAYEWAIASGVAGGQADLLFTDQRTLAASASEDLDLAGALQGVYGAAIALAKVKAVIIKAADGNTNDVQVTRPAANGVPVFLAAGDGIALGPGEIFAWFAPTGAGKTVTAGTGDLLTITNSAGGTSVTYDVLILGTSS